jgi:signal transduction histidine kinase
LFSISQNSALQGFLFQFYFFLSLSFLVSIIEFFLLYKYPTRIALLFQFVLVLLLLFQTDTPREIEYIVFSSFLLNIAVFEKYPQNLIFSCLVISISLYRFYPINNWGTLITSSMLSQMLFFFFFMVLLSFSLILMMKFRNDYIESRKREQDLSDAISRLTEANIGFQKYANEIEEKSIENERKRVSRDLHDILGSTMTNIIMMMDTANVLLQLEKNTEVMSIIKKTRSQADYGLSQTRASLYSIRDIHPLKVRGPNSLHKLVTLFTDIIGIDIKVDYTNYTGSESAVIDSIVYRIVQEGITNAFRHGKATKISIMLFQDNESLNITIQDNGQGASKIQEGIGIAGMRERLAPFGGKLHAGNIQNGFELHVILPFPKVSSNVF